MNYVLINVQCIDLHLAPLLNSVLYFSCASCGRVTNKIMWICVAHSIGSILTLVLRRGVVATPKIFLIQRFFPNKLRQTLLCNCFYIFLMYMR